MIYIDHVLQSMYTI